MTACPTVRRVVRTLAPSVHEATACTALALPGLFLTEIALVRGFADRVFEMMSYAEPFADDVLPDMGAVDEEDAAIEKHCQKVFQRCNAAVPQNTENLRNDFGTRCQSLVVRTLSAVHFLYRNTELWPVLPPPMHVVTPLPAVSE